jgi:hypothetical protein
VTFEASAGTSNVACSAHELFDLLATFRVKYAQVVCSRHHIAGGFNLLIFLLVLSNLERVRHAKSHSETLMVISVPQKCASSLS